MISVGARIESTLEIVMKIMIVPILFSLLFIAAPLMVTREALMASFIGLISVGYIPKGVDILSFGD